MFRTVLPGAALAGLACAAPGLPPDTPRPAAGSPGPAPRPTATAPAASLLVFEIRGSPGPTVALVGGVHGGKRSAMRALVRVADTLRAAAARGALRGTVLVVPVANAPAAAGPFAQLSPLDSLNLNRVFPGRPDGRPTERLAHRVLTEIVARSDYLVDLHGADGEEAVGAFAYAARPGLDARVDSAALRLATLWGAPRVVWDQDGPRTPATARFLQTAAHLSGVPAITVFEAGTRREEPAAIAAFEQGALRLLGGLGLLDRDADPDAGPPALHPRRAVTLGEREGRWTPSAAPGDARMAGEPLGTFIDSSGAARTVLATEPGVVLHIRREGPVPAGAALAILAASP